MAYLELPLSPADITDDAFLAALGEGGDGRLRSWAAAVGASEDPCLLLDADGVVLGISPSCVSLFGVASREDLVGRGVLDDVVDLVDFTADPGRLAGPQLERIPPLLALASGALSRGLLRVRIVDRVTTLDAVAAPVRADGNLVGSLTFFHRL